MNWNDRYEKLDTPWDKGQATPVVGEMFAKHPEIFAGKTIVPGCGPGHEARWLAAHGCEVLGLDIAELAIVQARSLDPDHTVRYECGDFLSPEAELIGAFDLLFEHTCFCALDPSLREAYIHAAAAVLRTGGILAGIFFIDPEMSEGEAGPPFGIPSGELESLWEAAGFAIEDSWVPDAGFPGRHGRERVMILRKI